MRKTPIYANWEDAASGYVSDQDPQRGGWVLISPLPPERRELVLVQMRAREIYDEDRLREAIVRLATLGRAIELGADDATLIALRDATRVARKDTIVVPAHRYEGLSRGRGWARLGRGGDVRWGERVDGGYRVGPGRWSVGSTDGFFRKGADVWDCEHLRVGEETWTVAS
jgi:hypothetical protein